MSQRKIGIILSYFHTFLHIIVNLLYVPLLLKTIGRNEYGLYQMVGSLMAYITIMETLLSSGILRYYCKYNNLGDESKKENILAISQKLYRILSLIVIFLSCCFGVVFYKFYKDTLTILELRHSIVMIGLLIINVVINLNNYVYVAVIIANEKFLFIRLLSIITTIFQPIIVLFLIRQKPNAVSVIFAQLLINIFICFLRKYYCKSKLAIKIKYHKKDNEFIRQLFSFSLGIFLATIADQIFWKSNQLIIGKMLDINFVAIYAIGAQIYLNYPAVGTAISGVFMNRLSELYDKEHNMDKISELFIKVGRLTFIILSLVLTTFVLYGQEFINIWAGNEYQEAYYIAIIIMIPLTVDVMQNLGLSILQITNKYSFRGKIYLFMAFLNILFSIFFIKYYGIIGASISTAISMAIGNIIIMNYYYYKVINLDIKLFWLQIMRILPYIFIVFIFGKVISFLVIGNEIKNFLLHIFIYGGLYIIFIYKFGMNNYEKGLVQRAIQKVIKRRENEL